MVTEQDTALSVHIMDILGYCLKKDRLDFMAFKISEHRQHAYEQGKREAAEWQPIETAPKDRVILLGVDSYDCGWVCDTGWWHEDKKVWMGTGHVKGYFKLHMAYTHWMHTAPPPTDEPQPNDNKWYRFWRRR